LKANLKTYSKAEEKLNFLTHGFGLLLSLPALYLLFSQAFFYNTIYHFGSYAIYGVSLIFLYLASTLFHLAKKPALRNRLNNLDRAAIYILIAGTYTPITLITLQKHWGLPILFAVWIIALFGILSKFSFFGKYKSASILPYIVLGWLIIFAAKPLNEALAFEGIILLLCGNIFYSFAAIIYNKDKIKFNHAILHLLVLAGSIFHYAAIYFFVR
jgi:hemolysin III